MNDIYTQINELFDEMKREGSRPSITQIAKKLGVSEERVRRTLITEGKWKSKTSAEVMQLFQKEYTVSQIAEALCISEKNVQSYLPYSRGMYGGEQTIEAKRCGQYRARMKSAEEKMNNPERKATEMKAINRPATFLEYEAQKGDENAREAVQKWYQKLESIRLETEQLWDRMKNAEMAECIQLANENQAYANARRGVYQLRLELSSGSGDGKPDRLGMDEADWQKFLKLANAKEGISRTILVPGSMHLHALHYLIQRLFGWQNSHLHRFGLTDADFQRVTAGRLGGWLDLCGTLFRMDSEDFGDIYWDDDYKQGQSVKTWFRKKYMPPYRSLAVTDTFLYNLNRSQEFERRLASNEREGMTPFTRDDLIEEFVRRMHPEFDMNTLLQRIRIRDLFIEEGAFGEDSVSERLGLWHLLEKGERGSALEEWENDFGKNKARKERLLRKLKDLLILRENINQCERGARYGNEEWIRKQTGLSPEEYTREAREEIDRLVMEELFAAQRYEPGVYPLFSSIMYNYDYGDDWFVKISCEKVYLQRKVTPARDFYGYPEDLKAAERIICEDARGEVSPALAEQLNRVYESGKPECIALDGMMVLDDVGGTHGFYERLQTLYGAEPEAKDGERNGMKQWARGQGWNGRMPDKDKII